MRLQADSGTGKITVLLVAGYDSTNAALAAIGATLGERGHEVVVAASDPADEVNNRPFTAADLPITALGEVGAALLDRVDAVIGSPIKPVAYDALYSEIYRRGLLVFSFANLLSSVTMRIFPDFVFAAGASTVRDFRAYGLDYNFILSGNPQYDCLGAERNGPEGRQAVRKVIVVDQGGYPYGKPGKTQLAEALERIARDNPDIEFDVKLRYVPDDRRRRTVHAVSEYLSAFLDDAPSNLRCLGADTVLEEVVSGYDAMIALWSTALRCALVLRMPLLLLSGFESTDVFDVRSSRVEAAYRHLEESGCVCRHDEVRGDITRYLRVADSSFTADELHGGGTPCSKEIATFIELACETLGRPRLRIAEPFALSARGYYERFADFNLVDAGSSSWHDGHVREAAFNARLQDAMHDNRCMGDVLDLSPLIELRPATASAHELIGPECIEHVNTEFESVYSAIESAYFESEAGRSAVAADPIAQDRWFGWLYGLGDFDAIENCGETELLVPETREYYLARIALDRGNLALAHARLLSFLKIMRSREVPQLPRCRKLGQALKPFKKPAFAALCVAKLMTKDGRDLAKLVFADRKGDGFASVMRFLKR